MKTHMSVPAATAAIFALAEIKAALEAFDRGDANACDAVDAVEVALEGYRAAASAAPQRGGRKRDAA